MDPSPLPEPRVAEMIAGVKDYMREEQALYLPASDPLSAEWRSALQHYFPESLLSAVKTVTLEGARIPPSAVLRRRHCLELRTFSRLCALSFGYLISASSYLTKRSPHERSFTASFTPSR